MVVSARVGTAQDLIAAPGDADQRIVLVEGFPVALGVVVGVVAAVTAAFVLSLPLLHPPIDKTMLGSGKPVHYSVARVRRLFADYGVPLRYTSHPSAHVVVLSVTPPPHADTALTVSLPAAGGFIARYGGANARVRARVAAASAALARSDVDHDPDRR
jgi:hypothetical protein